MSRDITYKGVSKINSGYTEKYKPLFVSHILVVHLSDSGKTLVILAIGAYS